MAAKHGSSVKEKSPLPVGSELYNIGASKSGSNFVFGVGRTFELIREFAVALLELRLDIAHVGGVDYGVLHCAHKRVERIRSGDKRPHVARKQPHLEHTRQRTEYFGFVAERYLLVDEVDQLSLDMLHRGLVECGGHLRLL